MSLDRDKWVLATTLISESAWLYAALGAAALAMGLGGSPLGWPAVLAIMGISLTIGRLSPSERSAKGSASLYRILIGATVLYVAIGTQAPEGVSLAWVFTVMSESAPEGYTFWAIAATALAVVLWWRGAMLAAQDSPTEALAGSFRLGVPALAVATTVDIISSADLYTYPMIFIFFASGLGGLGIGNLLPESQESAQANTWPRVMAVLVTTLVAIGLAFSLLREGVLSYVTAPVFAIYDSLVRVLVWGVMLPAAYLFFLIFDLIVGLFRGPPSPEQPREIPDLDTQSPEGFVETLGQIQGDGANIIYLQIIGSVLLAAGAVALIYLAAKSYRRRRLTRTGGRRESILEDRDVALDFARLLGAILPDWLMRRKRGPAFNLPDGPPGVVAALRAYYDLLTMAEEHGVLRGPHQTASEFEIALEDVFPRDLVHMVTEAFNRACYGFHPAPEERIAQIQSGLESLRLRPI